MGASSGHDFRHGSVAEGESAQTRSPSGLVAAQNLDGVCAQHTYCARHSCPQNGDAMFDVVLETGTVCPTSQTRAWLFVLTWGFMCLEVGNKVWVEKMTSDIHTAARGPRRFPRVWRVSRAPAVRRSGRWTRKWLSPAQDVVVFASNVHDVRGTQAQRCPHRPCAVCCWRQAVLSSVPASIGFQAALPDCWCGHCPVKSLCTHCLVKSCTLRAVRALMRHSPTPHSSPHHSRQPVRSPVSHWAVHVASLAPCRH